MRQNARTPAAGTAGAREGNSNHQPDDAAFTSKTNPGQNQRSSSRSNGWRNRDDWMRDMMADASVSRSCRLLLARLALFVNIKTGQCDPGYAKLAKVLSIKPRWAKALVREAVERGWLAEPDSRGRHRNNFRLTRPTNGARSDTVQ